MARHQRFFREDFDRKRTFVALKPFVFAGQGYVPGQKLDTSTKTSPFTDRRLRQLYDARQIGYPTVETPESTSPPEKPRIQRRRYQPGVKADGVPA